MEKSLTEEIRLDNLNIQIGIWVELARARAATTPDAIPYWEAMGVLVHLRKERQKLIDSHNLED